MIRSVSLSLYARIVPLPSVATMAALAMTLPAGSLMVAATGDVVPGCHTHKLVGPEGTTVRLSEYASSGTFRPQVPGPNVNFLSSWAFILPPYVSTARQEGRGLNPRFAIGSRIVPE